MNKMLITMLNGLGCQSCGGTCGQKPMTGLRGICGFGAVANYDIIRIGGGNYTTNQILDKTIFANRDTNLYSNTSGKGKIVGVVKAGQPIGVVYSYLKPTDSSTDGRGWLMFTGSKYLQAYFVPDESVSATGLKDQGTLTVSEEVKAEQDAKLKQDSPMEYYIKKYGTKAVLIIGGIIVAVSLGKELIKDSVTRRSAPAPATALTGPSKRKTKTKK